MYFLILQSRNPNIQTYRRNPNTRIFYFHMSCYFCPSICLNKQKYFNVTSDVFLTDSYENITATHHIKILIIVISTYRTRVLRGPPC